MKRVSRALVVSSVLFAACGGSGTDGTIDDGSGDPSSSGGTLPPSSSTSQPPGTNPPGKDPTDTNTFADLRADTNRDGKIDLGDANDDIGEDQWDAKHGAVFLANIDDDEQRCPTNGTDVDLPKCNDAADEVVNGDDDALDLARIRTKPWADAPADANASITWTVPDRVRLFRADGGSFTAIASGDKLTAAQVKAGVELAIEAKDIVRDKAAWDGFVDVTLTMSGGGKTESDKVRLRVSPLMTYHHLLAAEKTYVTLLNEEDSVATRNDLAVAATAAGVPAPVGITVNDQWTQDFFETAFMTMPGAGGAQHAMRVNIRSANEFNPGSTTNPLRSAGKVVFTKLRGKDSGAVQQFDPMRGGRNDTLNSFGNLETIPPYTNGAETFPLGRILRGKTATYAPDSTFLKMMEDQSVQPPVYIDTSWLLVGHVDETTSFIKASSPRGWVMLVNDPTLAKTMLQQQSAAGNGSVPMFVGKYWDQSHAAQQTIDQVLADTEVMQASAEAATEIAGQLATIKAATGLTDAEIVKIPFLHMPYGNEGSIAYQPGMVNGLYIAPGHFVAPDPHGPSINGQDIFKKAMQDALAPYGVTVHFAEDWDLYHRNMGEVHCGTNATRAIPQVKWWESGR